MPRAKKQTSDSKKKNILADAAKSIAEKAIKEPVAKMAASAKKEDSSCKVCVVLQYAGKNVTFDDLVQNAKNKYQYDMGGNFDAVKEIDLYVKPGENKVYFVIDNDTEGDYNL